MRWKRSLKKRTLTLHSLQQVGVDLRVALLLRSGGRCWYCGTFLTLATMTADHLVPVQRGGQAVLDNLVAACRACNTAKGTLSLDIFRARRGGTPFWGEPPAGEVSLDNVQARRR